MKYILLSGFEKTSNTFFSILKAPAYTQKNISTKDLCVWFV